MTNTAVSTALVPAKFILMMCQTLMIIVILYTKEDYIYASIDQDLTVDDPEYTSANVSILVCAVLFLVFMFLEFLVLFSGVSVFYDKANIV
jgi:hypothetical protein